ncbi:MAG: hypothetical protein P4L57_02535 [Rhizomicrobium sp.]|nr:hypothetical protein [Rhizomicrobium sp.]
MNHILRAAFAISLLGSSSAVAQTDTKPPAHKGLAEPAAAGEQKLSQTPRDETASSQSVAVVAGNTRQRLSDPKSGCAGFDNNIHPVDAIAWSGNCVGGLASGPGTMTFSHQGQFVESLTGDFDRGLALNGTVKAKFANGSSYEGEEVAAKMEGKGLFTTPDGDRLQGQWVNDRLNGYGVVTWSNGDRYEGQWRDGKAEGRGIQIWADGRKYDGDWRNDLPNGHGVVTRKDGSHYEATFADGHPAGAMATGAPAPGANAAVTPATMAASTVAPAQAVADDKSHAPSIEGLSDKKFSAIDGSTFMLAPTEGGLRREIVAPDGVVKKTLFAFLSDKLGSVHEGDDNSAVVGVFRVTASGIAVDYADGRSEALVLNRAGGVSMLQKAPSGMATCMAWYPDGHHFSLEERKAALAAYAGRIGLQEPPSRKSSPAKASCVLQAADLAPVPHAPMPKPHARGHANAAAPAVMMANFAAPSAPNPNEPIIVRTSLVHAVDGDAPVPAELTNATTMAANAPGAGTNEASASACLGVESDGRHWGFRNRCAFDVQFSYCLMDAGDPLTSCNGATVSGSVAANGFGSLIADQSLHDTNADHDFRWVACGGGAGEVVAHLDRSNPPAGRCLRPGAS